MAKNRYIGEYPVIGIRPIIDGRRGPTPRPRKNCSRKISITPTAST